MTKRLFVLASLACLSMAASVQAQTYPSRPINLVVTAAAGGVTDVVARAFGQKLTEAWGQQVIVENKGGGAHVTGATSVARAAPDGHTLLVAEAGTFVINPAIYPRGKLTYDEKSDFIPITGLVRINQALLASKSLPVSNVKELIELAKSKPGEVNYGTYGIGSSGHLNMLLLENITGIKLQPVHYKGAAPATNDVIAGHIPAMFVSASAGAPLWKDGKLKYLAVGGRKRLPQLPDIPTVAETVPGYVGVSWFGLFGPAGMPADTVAKINAEVGAMFADPEFQKSFMDRFMFQSIAGSPEELMDFIRKEEPKWRKVIAEAKLKVE